MEISPCDEFSLPDNVPQFRRSVVRLFLVLANGIGASDAQDKR